MKQLTIIFIIALMTQFAFANTAVPELACKISNGCMYESKNDLGYCVSKINIVDDVAQIHRQMLTVEVFLAPIQLDVMALSAGEIIASDELVLTPNGNLILGETVLELTADSNGKYTGLLVMEEDFSFNVTCTK
jgi:hypothetical protein